MREAEGFPYSSKFCRILISAESFVNMLEICVICEEHSAARSFAGGNVDAFPGSERSPRRLLRLEQRKLHSVKTDKAEFFELRAERAGGSRGGSCRGGVSLDARDEAGGSRTKEGITGGCEGLGFGAKDAIIGFSSSPCFSNDEISSRDSIFDTMEITIATLGLSANFCTDEHRRLIPSDDTMMQGCGDLPPLDEEAVAPTPGTTIRSGSDKRSITSWSKKFLSEAHLHANKSYTWGCSS